MLQTTGTRRVIALQAKLAAYPVLFAVLLLPRTSYAQTAQHHFLAPPDTFHNTRFWVASGTAAALYTGTVIGLNEIWYKNYPRTGFHFFNDWQEWEQMDKLGHLYTAQFESIWMYNIARWTGIADRQAQWVGAASAMVMQTTIEVLDGFSDQWGFSVPDFAFNTLGSVAFFTQQRAWREQRVLFKVSSAPRAYPDIALLSEEGEFQTTLRSRTKALYGTGFMERFLKDYNRQTIWASVNIRSFIRAQDTWFPEWLNVAIGYGAEHMYGGFGNSWQDDSTGAQFSVSEELLPRHRQWYLGVDIDLARLPVKDPLLRTLLGMLNVFKLPSPALEYSSVNGLRVHALHY